MIELGSYNRIPSIAFHIRNEDSVVAVIAENGFYLFQSHLFALIIPAGHILSVSCESLAVDNGYGSVEETKSETIIG